MREQTISVDALAAGRASIIAELCRLASPYVSLPRWEGAGALREIDADPRLERPTPQP